MSYQGFVIWAILHFWSRYERFIMTLGKCVVSEAWFLETNIPKYDLKWFVLWGMSCNLSVNSPKIFLGVDMICHIYYIYFWNTKICTLNSSFWFYYIYFQQKYRQASTKRTLNVETKSFLLESKTTLFQAKHCHQLFSSSSFCNYLDTPISYLTFLSLFLLKLHDNTKLQHVQRIITTYVMPTSIRTCNQNHSKN